MLYYVLTWGPNLLRQTFPRPSLPTIEPADVQQFVTDVMKSRIYHSRRFEVCVNDFAVKIRRRNSLLSFQSGQSPRSPFSSVASLPDHFHL